MDPERNKSIYMNNKIYYEMGCTFIRECPSVGENLYSLLFPKIQPGEGAVSTNYKKIENELFDRY